MHNAVNILNMQYVRVVYLRRGRPIPVHTSLISFLILGFYLCWSVYGYSLLFKKGTGCIKTDTLLTIACLVGLWIFFMLLFGLVMIILGVLIFLGIACCCPNSIISRPTGEVVDKGVLGNLKKIPFTQNIF